MVVSNVLCIECLWKAGDPDVLVGPAHCLVCEDLQHHEVKLARAREALAFAKSRSLQEIGDAFHREVWEEVRASQQVFLRC